jgi:hypothetical protein
LENHDAGESVEDIAYNFDLRPDDIRAVLTHAAGRHLPLRERRRSSSLNPRSMVLDPSREVGLVVSAGLTV